MAGGLMQLVAYGAQDVYLTAEPSITFFKVVYRRHTNFAVESIEQYFNNAPSFGRKGIATLSRNGDLVGQAFLSVLIPEVKYCGTFADFGHVKFAWVKNLGNAMIEETELEIGGSQIDRQYGNWLQIWEELTTPVGHELGLNKMLGNIPELTSISSLDWDKENNILKPAYNLYVPLQFYFCRNNGLALPLIALQYHEVKISVKFRPVDTCFIASEAFFKSKRDSLDLENVSLYINYIYLDTEERRRFAQVSHEYLIEQLQYTGPESISNQNNLKAKLNYNHPVKALYWVTKLGNYQGGKFMIYDHEDWERARYGAAKLLLLAQYDLNDFGFFQECVGGCGEIYDSACGVEYRAVNPDNEMNITYSDQALYDNIISSEILIGKLPCGVPLLKREKGEDLRCKIDGIIKIYSDEENENLLYPEVSEITRNDLTIIDLSIPIDKFHCDNRCEYIRRSDVIVWQHDNYGLLIDGTINPITEVELQLNGQIRQSKRSQRWYNNVVPYMNFTRTPKDGLGVFSFGLNPEEHQPSGTCNFSRIDTAQLCLWFTEFSRACYGDIFCNTSNVVEIYATNYNVLRIMSGMAGLAYSN